MFDDRSLKCTHTYSHACATCTFTYMCNMHTQNMCIWMCVCTLIVVRALRLHRLLSFCTSPLHPSPRLFCLSLSACCAQVGTGLGLPICKALVELMGSTLLLKSPNSLSGGSTFSFTLVAGVPGSRVGPFQGTENGAAVPNGSGMVAPNGKVTDEAAIERPTAATLPSGLRGHSQPQRMHIPCAIECGP